jgi:hypothetical protein
MQTISLGLRRYGAELLAFAATAGICRYVLGLPALALGAAAGIATYLLRTWITRLRL